MFLSTLNRNLKSWLMAVVGAEYVLGMLPRGTHDYARMIRPSELMRWSRAVGLQARDISGLVYRPLAGGFELSSEDVDVNYLCHLELEG